jgi:hypothetical protein
MNPLWQRAKVFRNLFGEIFICFCTEDDEDRELWCSDLGSREGNRLTFKQSTAIFLAETNDQKPSAGFQCSACLEHRCSKIGGPERDRTVDLRNAIAALSQLSYRPVTWIPLVPTTFIAGHLSTPQWAQGCVPNSKWLFGGWPQVQTRRPRPRAVSTVIVRVMVVFLFIKSHLSRTVQLL